MATTPHVSRRAFVTASAATLAGTVVAAAPLAVESAHEADQELRSLYDSWKLADAAADAAWERLEDAGERHVEPEIPSALIMAESDWELQLCARCNVGKACEPEFIEKFRTTPRKHPVRRPFSAEELARYPGLRADYDTITEMKPWPEAQARADAIVQAWDRWEAEKRAARDAAGLDEAQAEWQRKRDASEALRARIAVLPATTVQGLAMKATVAAECFGDPDCVDDELKAELKAGCTAEAMCVSIVRDLLAMRG